MHECANKKRRFWSRLIVRNDIMCGHYPSLVLEIERILEKLLVSHLKTACSNVIKCGLVVYCIIKSTNWGINVLAMQ